MIMVPITSIRLSLIGAEWGEWQGMVGPWWQAGYTSAPTAKPQAVSFGIRLLGLIGVGKAVHINHTLKPPIHIKCPFTNQTLLKLMMSHISCCRLYLGENGGKNKFRYWLKI